MTPHRFIRKQLSLCRPLRDAKRNDLAVSSQVRNRLRRFELVRAVTDAVIAVVVLMFAAFVWQQPFDAAEWVVAAMAFMLQYRGRGGLGVPLDQVVSSVLKRWALTVIVLLVIGLLTRFVSNFNEMMLLTWIAVTPLVQIAAHRLGPYVYAPIVRMRGLRRSIVVGSTDLGRSLPRRSIRIRLRMNELSRFSMIAN